MAVRAKCNAIYVPVIIVLYNHCASRQARGGLGIYGHEKVDLQSDYFALPLRRALGICEKTT